MPNKKTLLLDFDGVLAHYEGWKGEAELGPPLPAARAACFALAKHFKLICFTTRSATTVQPWLTTYGFSCIEGVTNIKIPALLQIDDRAIEFRGVWDDALLERIKQWRPWWSE
jgi:hypothetical protein